MVRYSQNDQFRQERKDFSMSFKEIKPEDLNFKWNGSAYSATTAFTISAIYIS